MRRAQLLCTVHSNDLQLLCTVHSHCARCTVTLRNCVCTHTFIRIYDDGRIVCRPFPGPRPLFSRLCLCRLSGLPPGPRRRVGLSPSSSRPPDDDRVLLLRYFPRERRTHRFVVFFFFVVVLEKNADCSCEQKATLFSATRRYSHSSSSHSTSSRRNTRSYSTCALEENTFQRNERLLVPVLSSRRGLFARTSYLPTNDDRFIVWCAFLVFSR